MGSDSDGELRVAAFKMEKVGAEFDMDIPPTSGMEYLRRVQMEAQEYPDVVVANLDRSTYGGKQTIQVHGSTLLAAPSGYAPSIEWQREQIAHFSVFRQNLVRNLPQLKKSYPKVRVPYKEDVDKWCTLCFGRLMPKPSRPILENSTIEVPKKDTCEGDIQENNDGDDNGQIASAGADITNDNAGSSDVTCPASASGSPPMLSILLQLDQATLLQVLEYHVNWFEATGFTEQQGQWFYALLAFLEKPLVPEACSLLRSLARNCANLRAICEDPSDPLLVPLNIFICLVARYFDQMDLADVG